MADLVVLDSQTHRNLRVSVQPGGEHSRVNVVSVVPREFPRLLAHYPIFFTKSTATGQFEPAALLGFERAENLFLVNGKWDVDYVPVQILRQPFSLIPRQDESGAGRPALEMAFDPASSRIQAGEGERLFLDDGQPSKFLDEISSMLSVLVSGASEAYAFTGRLAELDLIEPVQINVEFVNGSDAKLNGLYWIAAAALKKLSGDQLAELRDREFLEWMYLQIASISHMPGLVTRKNRILSGLAAS